MSNTNLDAVRALLDSLGVTPEILAQAVAGTAQVEARPARDQVAAHNVTAPASRAQRVLILRLTGVYPNDTAGFKGITKGQASEAITALKGGKTFKIGRKTLKPVAA